MFSFLLVWQQSYERASWVNQMHLDGGLRAVVPFRPEIVPPPGRNSRVGHDGVGLWGDMTLGSCWNQRLELLMGHLLQYCSRNLVCVNSKKTVVTRQLVGYI